MAKTQMFSLRAAGLRHALSTFQCCIVLAYKNNRCTVKFFCALARYHQNYLGWPSNYQQKNFLYFHASFALLGESKKAATPC